MKYLSIKSGQHKLSGVIHEAVGSVKPIVLIIHGYFSSNRVGYNRLYYDISQLLVAQDYTAVRCDLRGMGESTGSLSEVTFDDHVTDVQNITKHIYKRYKRKVIIIAHSIGCLISMQSYYNLPDLLERVILISPIFFNNKVLSRFFDSEKIKELHETGKTFRKGICVSNTFFDNKTSLLNVAKNIKKCKIPVSILLGDSDRFFQRDEISALHEATSVMPTIIPNGDHNFSEGSTRITLMAKIISILNEQMNNVKKIEQFTSDHFPIEPSMKVYNFYTSLIGKNIERYGKFTKENTDKNRVLFFVDGAIGSGKSTIMKNFIIYNSLQDLLFYSPEYYVYSLKSDLDFISQYNQAKDFLWDDMYRRVSTGESFIVESVFTKKEKVDLLRYAKGKGYLINGIYIGTSNPEINIARVNKRVKEGSFFIPEEKTVDRYYKSLQGLKTTFDISDSFLLFDNSNEIPVLVLQKCNNQTTITDTFPEWINDFLKL
jgi:predicted ABC-type ATPase/pimeloyl-ACP methyl ester carboxylesterase